MQANEAIKILRERVALAELEASKWRTNKHITSPDIQDMLVAAHANHAEALESGAAALETACLDTARLDRLEELPGRVTIIYNGNLMNGDAPKLRAQIDSFLARLDEGK